MVRIDVAARPGLRSPVPRPPFHPAALNRGIYAVAVEAPARIAFMEAALRAGLADRQPAVLVSPIEPEHLFSCWKRAGAGDLLDALADGSLRLFSVIGDCGVNLFRYGTRRFLAELAAAGVEKGSFIVVDQADDLFTLHDHHALVQQAKSYLEWMHKMRSTGLLCFLRTGGSRAFFDGNQAPLLYFEGAARVAACGEGFSASTEFWNTTDGHPLPSGKASRFVFDPDLTRPGSAAVTGPDGAPGLAGPMGSAHGAMPLVYYLGSDLPASPLVRQLARWQHVRSIDEIPAVLPDGTAPSVVVPYCAASRFRDLAAILHALRKALGEQACLLVREDGRRLRAGTELPVLRRIGLNGVVGAAESLTTVPDLIEAEAGRHLAAVPFEPLESLESLLAGRQGRGRGCVVSIAEFLGHASDALARSARSAVPCALVELRLDDAPGACGAPWNVGAVRGDDLMWGAADRCMLLLQGCDEGTLLQVLGRFFRTGRPARQLDVYLKHTDIQARLARMGRETGRVPQEQQLHGGSLSSCADVKLRTH